MDGKFVNICNSCRVISWWRAGVAWWCVICFISRAGAQLHTPASQIFLMLIFLTLTPSQNNRGGKLQSRTNIFRAALICFLFPSLLLQCLAAVILCVTVTCDSWHWPRISAKLEAEAGAGPTQSSRQQQYQYKVSGRGQIEATQAVIAHSLLHCYTIPFIPSAKRVSVKCRLNSIRGPVSATHQVTPQWPAFTFFAGGARATV